MFSSKFKHVLHFTFSLFQTRMVLNQSNIIKVICPDSDIKLRPRSGVKSALKQWSIWFIKHWGFLSFAQLTDVFRDQMHWKLTLFYPAHFCLDVFSFHFCKLFKPLSRLKRFQVLLFFFVVRTFIHPLLLVLLKKFCNFYVLS